MNTPSAKPSESVLSSVTPVNSALAVGTVALLGAIFVGLSGQEKDDLKAAHAAIRRSLAKIDPSDRIAVSVGEDILIFKASESGDERQEEARFPVGKMANNLLWIDSRLIVFSRMHDKALRHTAHLEKIYTDQIWQVASSVIQILDTESGKIETVFDPYRPSTTLVALFGDITEADRTNVEKLAADIEAQFALPEGSSTPGNTLGPYEATVRPGEFYVQDIGIIPGNREVLYLKVKDSWYEYSQSSGSLTLLDTVPPQIIKSQLNSPASTVSLHEHSEGAAPEYDESNFQRAQISAINAGMHRTEALPIVGGGISAAWMHKPD